MKNLSIRFPSLFSAPLHIQLRRLRWAIPIIVLALAGLHQVGSHFLVRAFFDNWQEEVELLLYTLTGTIVAWFGLSRIADTIAARAQAESRLRTAYADLEANHQRMQTLHNLGRQVSTADSEQGVLELAVQAPLQLTGALASAVVTFDDDKDRLKLDMAWGLSDQYLHAMRQHMEKGIPAGRCRTCVALKTYASSDCPLFVGLHQEAQAEGIGGLICLPMTQEQERLGVISAYFPSPDGPPEDQVRLLYALVGAITAMLESLRQRTRQVDTLYALKQASRTTDLGASALNDFSQQVLNTITSGWGAQAGGLFLYDENTQAWTCRARRGLGEDLTDPRFNLALETVRQAYDTGSTVILPEITPESECGLPSVAASPLIAEGKKLGAIFLGSQRRRAFQSRQSELLDTMALQIALAIRNFQLYDQLDQLAVLKERYRLSREFHDGLAQTLASLNLQTERLETLIRKQQSEAALQEVGEMRQAVHSAYADVREAIEGLRLELAEPDQMAPLLTEYVAQFSRQTGIQAQLTIEPPGLLITPATALQLMRIAQEALANVRRHAQASQAEVSLRNIENKLELTITDNGLGFPDALPEDLGQHHFGLATMRERARSLGGALTIATGVHQGTRITVAVPNSKVQKNGVNSP